MSATPPQAPPAGPAPTSIITGGMTVEITVGEVRITIEGPVPKVIAVLNWLFGADAPSAVIAKLQLVFGSEVAMRTK